MCGLVGVVTKRANGFTREQQEIFSNLLFIDMLRGDDSTGMFVIENNGDAYVAKDEGGPLRFMNSKEYDDGMRRAWQRGAAMIGHNRKATRGVVNDVNAHPFNVDDKILLVHNGTMFGDHKKHADVEVDSHAIAHLIHEKGSVSEALSSFNGAYALIWYDVVKMELNLVRNADRPLWWMETDDAIVWSSEKSMLEFVASPTRLNLKITTEPVSLPPDTLQKFTLNKEKKWDVSSEKVEVKKPEPPPYVYTGESGGGANYDYGADWYENYHLQCNHPGSGGNLPETPFRPTANATPPQHPQHGPTVSPRGDNMGPPSGQQAAIQLLPRPSAKEQPGSKALRPVRAAEPPEWSNLKRREQSIARRLNKTVNYGEYRDGILRSYPYNTVVHVAPFEYETVNGTDGKDGWYLYASPFDDEDVIIRQFMGPHVSEERMMQLAGCDYIFEFNCNVRSWNIIDGELGKHDGKVMDDTSGYVIIRSSECKLVSTGLERGEKSPH